jgi:hypothetical protein
MVNKPTEKVRIYSIDLLRFVAITGMIVTHFVGFMSDNALLPYQILIKQYVYYFGSLLSVPLFLYCSGFSMAYASLKKKSTLTRVEIIKKNMLKGFVLLVFGILYTMLIHGFDKVTYFWILQCIGVYLIVFSLIFDMVALSSLLILISFAGVMIFQFFPQLYQLQVTSINNFKVIRYLITLFISGNFAIIPWSVFFLIGIITGYRCAQQKLRIGCVIIISCVLIVTSLVLMNNGDFRILEYSIGMAITKYPVSMNYVILFSGISLFLAAIGYWLFDYKKIVLPSFNVIQRISTLSLTIFCVHYAGGLVFLLKGVSRFTTEPLVAIAATFLFIWGFGIFSVWWQKYDYRYSLEYFMKIIDRVWSKEQ